MLSKLQRLDKFLDTAFKIIFTVNVVLLGLNLFWPKETARNTILILLPTLVIIMTIQAVLGFIISKKKRRRTWKER
ncbi:hypothetical protein N1M2_183 [Klebsiella phage N1M2]|uniref:Uncharacterized protein n=1 Tax=Klebsiella phage N1M2 TaxID=2664939 RepID=A0A6B7ZEZ1_9CAUD|nr:hypothetical protein PQB72_gp183 [Klebsiella phage N1M2]QGH72046.1 hypothetical protein N1M2_183 [Klebsiella phage N1M2]